MRCTTISHAVVLLPSAVFDFSPPESQPGSEHIERTELLPLSGPPEVQEHSSQSFTADVVQDPLVPVLSPRQLAQRKRRERENVCLTSHTLCVLSPFVDIQEQNVTSTADEPEHRHLSSPSTSMSDLCPLSHNVDLISSILCFRTEQVPFSRADKWHKGSVEKERWCVCGFLL